MRNSRWGGAIAIVVTVVGLVFGVAGCTGTSGSVGAGAGGAAATTSAVSASGAAAAGSSSAAISASGLGSAAASSSAAAVTSSSSAKAPPSSSNPGAGNAPTGASILKPFIGSWTGHDRILTIASNGIATEKVFDGCCTIAYTLTFRIDHASGNHANGSLYATVTSATFNENPNWPSPGSPEAQKGQSGIVGVQDGVLVDAFAGGTFCDNAADVAGKCGL